MKILSYNKLKIEQEQAEIPKKDSRILTLRFSKLPKLEH